MPFDKFRWYGVTYEEARTGCYNGEARLEDMDIDGVDAEILFPPQRTMSHFLGDDDDDFVLAGVEAYNNFLFEEFCAPDPKRLIGMAQIPSLGIDNAVDALRKAKARGAKGVLISNWPSGGEQPLARRRPVLGRRGRRGHAVSIHINIISRAAAQRAAARPRPQRGNQLYDMTSEATRAKAIGGMSHVFSMATGDITDMIFTGVFERFPELQVVLDRDRRRLDPALPRVPRRPLVAQPRVGRPPARASRRRSTGTATTRRRSSPTAPASSCATASASTT